MGGTESDFLVASLDLGTAAAAAAAAGILGDPDTTGLGTGDGFILVSFKSLLVW